ncbi:hypothetical protein [Streptomyces sp. NPDC088812]|uniref:hypothetical protein n=1 Tax=Streptomyces sp. NPDC088812 TaxID=3365905 RepID=UPI0038241DFC
MRPSPARLPARSGPTGDADADEDVYEDVYKDEDGDGGKAVDDDGTAAYDATPPYGSPAVSARLTASPHNPHRHEVTPVTPSRCQPTENK